jgi:hypothetical protein
MVRISVLNDALKSMYNAEKRGKKQVLIRPVSKVVIKFLQVMQKHGASALPLPRAMRAVARGGWRGVRRRRRAGFRGEVLKPCCAPAPSPLQATSASSS